MGGMKPVFEEFGVTLFKGDCRDVMKDLPDASVDAVVTDPPYEISFMGRAWDGSGIAFDPVVWAEAYRVLKPGGHMLVFGGTRTWHRVAVAVEDAGFEIRDSIAWIYASGFPKSLDVSKAIDKAAGAERVMKQVKSAASAYSANAGNHRPWMDEAAANGGVREVAGEEPVTDDAKAWQGWGTALKPAHEPIVLARKPLSGTVAQTVLEYGTGALNIDATRVGIDEVERDVIDARSGASTKRGDHYTVGGHLDRAEGERFTSHAAGRFPANVIFDESQAAALDKQSGWQKDGFHVGRNRAPGEDMGGYSGAWKKDASDGGYGGAGGASRFFYVAKAPAHERPEVDGTQHATVKPLTLMRYLVKLVTPPGGTVLEPFAGSGTTLEACVLEGFSVIGAELDTDGTHIPLIIQRLSKPLTPAMF